MADMAHACASPRSPGAVLTRMHQITGGMAGQHKPPGPIGKPVHEDDSAPLGSRFRGRGVDRAPKNWGGGGAFGKRAQLTGPLIVMMNFGASGTENVFEH